MRATVDRAGPGLARPTLEGPDPPRQEERPLQGPRRHRARLRRLLRAPARHAPAPGVRRRAVRAPSLAHGAVGLLRGRGGRRQDRRRRASPPPGAALGLVGPVAVLTNYQNQTIGAAALAAVAGFLRREQDHAAGRGDVSREPQAPRALSPLRLPAEVAHRGHEPRAATGATGSVPAALRRVKTGAHAATRTRRSRRPKKKAALLRVHRITNARVPRPRPRQGDRDRRRPRPRRHAPARARARPRRLRHLPHARRERGAHGRALREVPRHRSAAEEGGEPRAVRGRHRGPRARSWACSA